MNDRQQVPLSSGVRQCSEFPATGTAFIRSDVESVSIEDARSFLRFLEGRAADAAFDIEKEQHGISSIKGAPVSWTRRNFQLFPFYIERLVVVDDAKVEGGHLGLPMKQGVPGEWLIGSSVFNPQSHYSSQSDAWKQLFTNSDSSLSGGLSLNWIEVPATRLQDGTIDIRPLVLHALAPDGSAPDRTDSHAQAAIANAFWQTFWATGAHRAERGNTFPVAFLPIDRSHPLEFEPPFHSWYVSLRRQLYGRTSMMAYGCELLTQAHALEFDCIELRFHVTKAQASAQFPQTMIDQVISELNRTAFVDAFTGANKDLFQAWRDSLDGKQSEQGESANCTPRSVRIHRVVPYSGCAFLYQAVSEIDKLRASGKVQDFDDEILAATNATFFLNFPEEYATLHSAMNDPVSLLVENGRTHQIKTMRRAAFVLTNDGKASITTGAGNRILNEVLVYEGESASVTAYDRAHGSYADNEYGPLFFGAVIVGDSIVETFEEIRTEVPANGWIVGDSEAFGGQIDPRKAAIVQVKSEDGRADLDIRHAFAVGPLLVQNGKAVLLGESREEFQPIVLKETPSFADNAELSRTQVPAQVLHCEKKGVAPSRFPYDWEKTRAPRSALGIRENGDVVLAVIDGRADLPHSVGATLAELAQIMINLGCVSALNMDGGGSSVMFVQDEVAKGQKLRPHLRDGVVNLPSDMGGVERLLPVPLVISRRKSTAA